MHTSWLIIGLVILAAILLGAAVVFIGGTAYSGMKQRPDHMRSSVVLDEDGRRRLSHS